MGTGIKAGILILAAVIIVMLWRGATPDGFDAPPMPAASTQDRAIRTKAPQLPPAAPERRLAPDSIEDMVRALSPSGTPEQYLDVFQKIQSCLELEHEKAIVVGSKVKVVKAGEGYEVDLGLQWATDHELAEMRIFCSTMTGRTRSDRHQLLQYALDHHANGALAAYITEGPNGERNALQERPTDPAVVEWRDAALRRLESDMNSGYTDAISFSLHGFPLLGKTGADDLYLSFLVNNKVLSAINSGKVPFDQKFLDAFSASLTQQQKDEAERHASRILVEWKRRNNRQ